MNCKTWRGDKAGAVRRNEGNFISVQREVNCRKGYFLFQFEICSPLELLTNRSRSDKSQSQSAGRCSASEASCERGALKGSLS